MCTAMDVAACIADTQDDTLSKLDSRKSNKPLMEKKRRQRINRCLNDLKSLVLEGMKKDPSRYSKLEKADILEMTVRHVQALHRHEGVNCRLGGGGRLLGGGRSLGGDERTKYRAGFIHCAVEVTRYLAGLSGVPHDLHHRLISHLNTVTSSLTSVPGVGQLPGASVAVGGGVVTVAPPPASHLDSSPLITTSSEARPGVPYFPASSVVVSCRSPPPAASPESPPAALVATSVSVGTASVALVPASLAPRQVALVLPPVSSSPASSMVAPPLVTTTPRTVPFTPTTTHSTAPLGVSEDAPTPLTSQIPKSANPSVPNSPYSIDSNVPSSAFALRILPVPSSTPISQATLSPDNNGTKVVTGSSTTAEDPPPGKSGVAAVTLSTQTQTTCSTSTSWAAPLGLQVSDKFSSTVPEAAKSSAMPPAPLWPSTLLVRPTPTLPTPLQQPSSPSSSSMTSSPSYSSSSSSQPTASATPEGPPRPIESSVPPASWEPLNLAITTHPREPPSRPSLKAPPALPWSRPCPYPLPRPQSPRPLHPWRPW